jgi:hypothetical protein
VSVGGEELERQVAVILQSAVYLDFQPSFRLMKGHRDSCFLSTSLAESPSRPQPA